MRAEASWKQRSKLVVTLTFMQIGIRSKDILLRLEAVARVCRAYGGGGGTRVILVAAS
jgi:hypothetical protein